METSKEQSEDRPKQEKGKGIKEKIEEHVVVVLLLAVMSSFIAGWSAHDKATEAGGWAKVSFQAKEDCERLRSEHGSLKARVALLEKRIGSLTSSEVVINSPSNGDTVGWKPMVWGRLTGRLKPDEHLWLVVHPNDSWGWYPQVSEVFTSGDGTWHAVVFVGREKDDENKTYDVVVVIAPKEAHETFNKYIDRANRKGEYPETPLPEGIRLIGKVNVIRK